MQENDRGTIGRTGLGIADIQDTGLDLYPVLLSLMDWGARHLHGQAMTLTHKNCGATMMPHLACPECGEQVEARDMHAVRTDAALPKSA